MRHPKLGISLLATLKVSFQLCLIKLFSHKSNVVIVRSKYRYLKKKLTLMLGGHGILLIFRYLNDDNFTKIIVHYIFNIFGREYYYENGNYIMNGIEI